MLFIILEFMSLSIGIVGLPNVGKSTLFNVLTKKMAAVSNYPFCTIDPNVGVVRVPDERLNQIAAITKPLRTVPTTIEFIDIAGLVKNAHQGEGLGNQFLATIRECQAICEVVRNFADNNIVHVSGQVDPMSDRETINLELIYADLQTIEKRLSKVAKEVKSFNKEILAEQALLEKIKNTLNSGRAARTLTLSIDDSQMIKGYGLLTAKPIIYVLNINEKSGSIPTDNWDGKVIALDAKLEEEIARLPEAEQADYIKELGLGQSGLDKLISASYRLLNLITFFTIESKETKAWTTKSGTKAPQAASEIHTDFEKNFVRAEVINCQDFVKVGGETTARDRGLVRTEGKDYIVQDGDICRFLINK